MGSRAEVWKIIFKEINISSNTSENSDPESVMTISPDHIYIDLCGIYK